MGTVWQSLIRKGSAGNVVELLPGPEPAAPRRGADVSAVMNLDAAWPSPALANREREESGVHRGIEHQGILPRPDDYAPARHAMSEHREVGGYEMPRDYGATSLSDRLIEQPSEQIVNIPSEALHPQTLVAHALEQRPSEPTAVTSVADEYAPSAPTSSAASQGGNLETDRTEQKAGTVSHIAAGATVSGGIHDYGDGEVCVGGKFTPEKLTCGDLTILAGASVRGDISASGLVKIFGKVDDTEILAKGIEIYDGAEVIGGGLKSETIGIQVGAHISGAITTRTMRNTPQ